MIVGENRLTSIILHFYQLGLGFATGFFWGFLAAGTGRRWKE
jgi:hypothetical protein